MAGSHRSHSHEMTFRFTIDDFDILSSPITSQMDHLSSQCFEFEGTGSNIFDLPNLDDFQIPLPDDILPFPPPPVEKSKVTLAPPIRRKPGSLVFRPFASFQDLELTVKRLRMAVENRASRAKFGSL
jgi:hypothetical protein